MPELSGSRVGECDQVAAGDDVLRKLNDVLERASCERARRFAALRNSRGPVTGAHLPAFQLPVIARLGEKLALASELARPDAAAARSTSARFAMWLRSTSEPHPLRSGDWPGDGAGAAPRPRSESRWARAVWREVKSHLQNRWAAAPAQKTRSHAAALTHEVQSPAGRAPHQKEGDFLGMRHIHLLPDHEVQLGIRSQPVLDSCEVDRTVNLQDYVANAHLVNRAGPAPDADEPVKCKL
eukprot:CAMPEP_0117527774 /NCGR_PEP_ID=MMETSP0784-20121206/36973_1 /TAXON_ID=39447 /ORGANISM="" /LENGTH=238 /DNA_ID=CAMNT_0005324041 /DNA_START=68 /DNA_END=787 /DNA_ORIENTATION=-